MFASAIRQVSVWLDERAPRQGAFCEALEWASRLHLPLQAVVLSDEQLRQLRGRSRPFAAGEARISSVGEASTELLSACETLCDRRGVSWGYNLWQGPISRVVSEFLHPTALSVFSSALADGVKDELLRQWLHGAAFPVLVCPPTCQPISRVLVVNQSSNSAQRFLDSVAGLCHALDVSPVVLTVARNEREAEVRQDAARQVWENRGIAADFDLLIGCDVRVAVASVTRWRRCTHVFVERRQAPPWWRWLRGDTLWRLQRLTDSFRVLAIPADMGVETLATPAPIGTRHSGVHSR